MKRIATLVGLLFLGGLAVPAAGQEVKGDKEVKEPAAAEPEWATFGATILGITLVFGVDIWRYLAFALPLAVVLFARASARWTTRERVCLYVMGAIGTWYTQRPFEHVSLVVYFRDWFPYYVAYLGSSPFPSDILWPVWRWRYPVTAAVFVLAVISNVWRRRSVKAVAAVAGLQAI